MEKSAVVPDHDIHVAFGVDVSVVAIGALEENFEVATCVGRVRILKRRLDGRVGVLGLRDRSLTGPRLKLS